MTHDDNLARVQALREDGAPWCLGNMRVETAVCDHIEDVLTRHAPVPHDPLCISWAQDDGPVCNYCADYAGGHVDAPCPDYESALTLLDALDGGGFPRSVYPATPGMANVALYDSEVCMVPGCGCDGRAHA